MKSAFMLTFIALCAASDCTAAGLEKSGQSISPFLESGNYAEISAGVLNGNISGEISDQQNYSGLGITDYSTGNLVNTHRFYQGAVKFQINPAFSAGLIFDQPFGTDISYSYAPNSLLGKNQLEAINVQFRTQSLTGLLGYQPTRFWNFYGGVSWQRLEGSLNISGANYWIFDGYDTVFSPNNAYGWLTGISYQVPDIALRASLTYRSKIRHEIRSAETLPMLGYAESRTQIQTPQSLNLDFSTGISPRNLIYSSLRWVNWQKFQVQPSMFSSAADFAAQYVPEVSGIKLISYKNNQWSIKLGWAHQYNDRWVSTLDTSWDSGSGNPASTLNPADGFNGLGFGLRYNIKPQRFIAGGAYYLKFKPSQSADGENAIAAISTLDNREAWAYGIKAGTYF